VIGCSRFIVSSMFAEVFVGFGSPLAQTRLETIGPIADDVRGHGRQQRLAPCFAGNLGEKNRQELIERLQRAFETDFPRRIARLQRCRRHHAANEIVAKQMRPELVANALGRLASQVVHLQDRLEAPQMQLRLPSSAIQQSNFFRKGKGKREKGTFYFN